MPGEIHILNAMHEMEIIARMNEQQQRSYLHNQMMRRIRDKEENMRSRLCRRRTAIFWKWFLRAVYLVAAMIFLPIFIGTVSSLWSWALS